MNRPTLMLAALVIVGILAGVPTVGTAVETVPDTMAEPVHQQSNGNVTTDNATRVSPGERLSAVIGVQEAEFEGEIEHRSFGIAVARAASADAKAAVVKERFDALRERLHRLEDRKAKLREARDNGSISEGRFQAEMTELSARTSTAKRLANASEETARTLPQDSLERKGINVDAIRELKRNAENLTGPEVAAIARSIAGRQVGAPVAGGPSGSIGPPGDRGPGSGTAAAQAERTIDRADRQVKAAQDGVDRAQNRIQRTNGSDAALDALERARSQLADAERALERARNALAAGNTEEAVRLAEQASDNARQATRLARSAIDRSMSGDDYRRGGDQDQNTSTDTQTGSDDGDRGANRSGRARG